MLLNINTVYMILYKNKQNQTYPYLTKPIIISRYFIEPNPTSINFTLSDLRI